MRSKPSASKSGERAEQVAGDFLRRQGLKVVTTNYRCRGGEIDLVARDGQTLVFAEVRLRNHRQFGGGAASVDWRKQQKVIVAARHYLQALYASDPPECRFDVLSLSSAPEKKPPYNVEWIPDAFRPDD
ncbi:MAG: YraN family protein [Porticoccaceae bacterium]|nr:YraN family protein [Porticoccaceae bacterium]